MTLLDPEVRYPMLRPAQVVARRKACPIAYVPLGNLEWHGPHNPLGADTLQAEGLAIRAAQKAGGLVLPPLWYGENRHESLMEANARDREAIAGQMDLPAENFNVEKHPYDITAQTENYHRLLLHILAQVESLGFRVGVLVAGHYPLIDHARAAVTIYNHRYRGQNAMLAYACVDYLIVKDRYPAAGDHAAGWETSHLMHLHPETVDLSLLPEESQTLIGIGGNMPPQHSSAEFGRETLEYAADVLIGEAHHRLNHPGMYQGSGMWLREGLWRQEQARE